MPSRKTEVGAAVARVWLDAGWFFATESQQVHHAPTPAVRISKSEAKRQAVIAARDAVDIRDADRPETAA